MRLSYSNLLSAKDQHAEALTHFAAAVEARPNFGDARYNLGLELARAGKVAEALTHFGEAARLDPESPAVRYNYGIALAKAHRYAEAAHEFQEALKHKPEFPAAREALQRVEDLQAANRPK